MSSFLTRLGFKKIINASGHYTVIGGSCPSPGVQSAMARASEQWVDMIGLQRKVGEMLSEILGCEDGIVASGAYAANSISALAAASRSGQVRGSTFTGNVLIQKGHVTSYAPSFEVSEIRLKTIKKTSRPLEEHADSSTVALTYVVSEADVEYDLRETVEAGQRLGLTTIVDAAVVDPPIPAIRDLLRLGPDVISVSGGKGLNGPNSTGLLIGKSVAIDLARALSFPNYGPGRGMKVSKEQVAGLMEAIREASLTNPDGLVRSWKKQVEEIRESVGDIRGTRTEVVFPWKLNRPQPVPRLLVFPSRPSMVENVRRRLAHQDPPILTRPPNGPSEKADAIVLDVRTLKKGEAELVGEALGRSLSRP